MQLFNAINLFLGQCLDFFLCLPLLFISFLLLLAIFPLFCFFVIWNRGSGRCLLHAAASCNHLLIRDGES